MDDQQFADFCADHPDLFFEVTADGELIVMPPKFSIAGFRNAEISGQLGDWARREGRGCASGSSTGFVLPNGARRSADAAWMLKSRFPPADSEERHSFWHLCPDFVIELRSTTDRLPVLHAKMREWVENGAQVAWLIGPERRAVEIFRPGQNPEVLLDPPSVSGEGPLAGFTLSLPEVWDPLA